MNSDMFAVYILLGVFGTLGILAFIFVFVVPRVTGYRTAKRIKLTIPNFDWKVIKQESYPYHTLIYLGGMATHFELKKGTAANGIYGYITFTFSGVNDDNEMQFKVGDNIFLFWTEWNRFCKLVKDNGGEIYCTHTMSLRLKDLKSTIEQLNNLKVIEENNK